MPNMEYGQQAISAMQAAEKARAAEARMREEGTEVASPEDMSLESDDAPENTSEEEMDVDTRTGIGPGEPFTGLDSGDTLEGDEPALVEGDPDGESSESSDGDLDSSLAGSENISDSE